MADARVCSVDNCGKPTLARELCSMHYARWRHHGDPLVVKRPANGAARHFYETTVLPCRSDDCLFWPFYRLSNGYALMRDEGKARVVSRLACHDVHGDAPSPRHEAAHSCGNGHLGCVNPLHIRWATPTENQADRILHGTTNRGERQGQSKLTKLDVLEIRRLKGGMTQSQIAERFGICRQAVSDIHRRLRWAHVA